VVNSFDRIDQNAKEFSKTLNNLAIAIDGDIEDVVRLAIFKVFASIIKRSPVDKGAYRASHGISNSDPGGEEDLRKGEFPGGGGTKGLAGAAWQEREGWRWRIEDGTIYIFNNQPYSLKLEDGTSKQAPAGIYALALSEFDQIWRQELNGFDRIK